MMHPIRLDHQLWETVATGQWLLMDVLLLLGVSGEKLVFYGSVYVFVCPAQSPVNCHKLTLLVRAF